MPKQAKLTKKYHDNSIDDCFKSNTNESYRVATESNKENSLKGRSSVSYFLERNYHRSYNASKPSSCVFKVPLMSQHSSNTAPVKHHSLISFLQDVMPEKEYSDLNCLVQIHHRLGIHPKQFDDEFSGVVRQFNDQWNKQQQEFLSCTKEEKAKRLTEDPSMRIKITQLTKYLERYQILELREKFPMMHEDNLTLELRQHHYLPTLEEKIRHKISMIPTTSKMNLGQPQNKHGDTTNKKEDELCIVCCDEKAKVMYSCGHSCCCSSCSKKITQCPLCRAPIEAEGNNSAIPVKN